LTVKFQHIVFKIALLLSAIFLSKATAWAQSGVIELLPGTQKLEYNEKTGAQKLVGGGINLNYEGNRVYADSAYYYEARKLVKAFGHVQVTKNDSLNLYCDSLWYFTDTKKAKLFHNIRVINDDYQLTTDFLDYDAHSGKASYFTGGEIKNLTENETLTSVRGSLYPNQKRFHFSKNVQYRSDSLTMDTDTLQYDYRKKKVYFFGNTLICRDTTTMFCKNGWFQTEKQEGVLNDSAYVIQGGKSLFGDHLYINETEKMASGKGNVRFIDTTSHIETFSNIAFMSKKAQFGYATDSLTVIYKMKKDTFYVHSDSILLFTDTAGKLVHAELFDDVQIYGTKMQAACDSISLVKAENRMTLYRMPMVWSENSELKGDTIQLFYNDSVITKAALFNNATAVMEIDSGKYYNQVGGKRMDAYFQNNELKQAYVAQNAQTNYFPQDTIRTDSTIEIQRKGMARLSASQIRVYLDSGEVVGVTYYKNPDGAFYPMAQIPADEQFIKNFAFTPQYRPTSPKDIYRKKRNYKSIKRK